jgi:hypothetical protein
MCKVKSCDRPSFVGGLCGQHALEGWSAARQPRRDVLRRLAGSARAAGATPRTAPRPVSG